MRKPKRSTFVALMLLTALLLFSVTGCHTDDANRKAAKTGTGLGDTTISDPASPAAQALAGADAPAGLEASMTSELDNTQRNSIGMLNNLAVLMQKIQASPNSRLVLEEAYASLMNNTYPNAVDARTLEQLSGILDTLETFRMTSIKRQRLQYLYEQSCAQVLLQSVCDSLTTSPLRESFDLPAIAFTVAHMAVDIYAAYVSDSSPLNRGFLWQGWALDEEAAAVLHRSRKEMFGYMVQIVGDYNLPGDLALSENAVEEFVSWENNSNVIQRIQFLEANGQAYQALGTYWLVLAESYYTAGEYAKCLSAVASYEALNLRIFRKDYEYARILPLAIVAAGETLSGDAYAQYVAHGVEQILANTDYDDWALRYIAAQAYVDLYTRTEDVAALAMAYEITVNNVNSLVNTQKQMNAAYLNPVAQEPTPQGASEGQKADINNYNLLKEERKTALPPLYKPLLLNGDLLFLLARQLEVPLQEEARLDEILHENGEPLFLSAPIDRHYRFAKTAPIATDTIELAFDGKTLRVPANIMAADTAIRVTILDPADASQTPVVLEDWALRQVERSTEATLATFTATYQSALAEKQRYPVNAEIRIEILPEAGTESDALLFHYTTVPEKTWILFDAIGFRRV